MTQLARQQAAMRATQHEIQLLLQWSEEQYAQFVYECGLVYLTAYLGEDPDGRRLLERDPLYWGWWKNNFFRRDEAFLTWAFKADLFDRTSYYLSLNDPFELVNEIRPSKNVVGNAYALQRQ